MQKSVGYTDREIQSISLDEYNQIAQMEILSIEIFGALEDEADLFPTPDQVTYYDEVLDPKTFCCYSGADKNSLRAGEILAEKYLEMYREV